MSVERVREHLTDLERALRRLDWSRGTPAEEALAHLVRLRAALRPGFLTSTELESVIQERVDAALAERDQEWRSKVQTIIDVVETKAIELSSSSL